MLLVFVLTVFYNLIAAVGAGITLAALLYAKRVADSTKLIHKNEHGEDVEIAEKRIEYVSKHKIRMFAALLIFGVIAISLGYNLFSNVVKIREMKKEKITLNNKILELEKEKEVLETDIMKLEDPDYIAKYVREKYFYSKDGELILRMDK